MPTRRHPLSRAMLGTAAGLLAVGLVGPGSGDATTVSGGTFNVSFMANALDYVDPALSYTGEGFAVLDATCAQLLTYPDEPPPGGYRLVPGAAAGFPRVSRDGKTYTFTIRNGYRFSDGTPVRADAFARSITRALLPGANSPGAQYAREIVGADAVSSGKSTSLSGVAARGNRLVIHLLKPVLRLPGEDDDAVLLRRPTDASHRSRRRGRLPRLGAVLRLGVRSRSAHRPGAEPVLRGTPAAPGRPLRRRSPGRYRAGGARPDRARPGRLGPRSASGLLRRSAGARATVWRQSVAVLRQAGAGAERVLP